MGLSAEELNAETLFPGDTIEYFSMAFVAGDPRGHRVAKVLKVLKDEPEYPLRLESQELLPITLMIRRKLDRHDDEIDPAVAKWRKIRTFKLVTGEVKGKTRANRLNEGLKQSMTSAIQAAKATFAAQKGSISEPFKDDEMAEKRAKKKKKKKIKPEPKSKWFQQQQLSFFKRDAPKDKDKDRDRDKDDFQAKRVSLDSMSRREEGTGHSASSSSSSSQRLRKEESSSALKHKKPRLLLSSPSSPLSQQKPPRIGALLHHKKSSSSPFKSRDPEKTKRLPAAVTLPPPPPPPPRESKYFSGSLQKHTKKPNGSLLQFMDEIEEKKSSRGTTLDEYLALDREQKSLIQKLKRPKSDDGDVETRTDKSSSSSSNSSKWERDRQDFCAKPQQESRWKVDSQFLGNWLKSGSKQQQQQQQQAKKKSDRQSSFSPGKRTSLDRPKNGTTLSDGQSPKRKDLNFLMTPPPKATGKQQQQQRLHKQQNKPKRNDENDREKDRDLHRKRKRSSDFSSPARRSHKASERSRAQSPTTLDLMGTWISKKRG